MSTPRTKKSRFPNAAPGLAAAADQRARAEALPDSAGDAVLGPLPGDEESGMYWEGRVAAWLGLPRRRLAMLRAGRMRHGPDWQVVGQEVVFTARGIEKLRRWMPGVPEQKQAREAVREAERTADPAPAPVGPPERAKACVLRTFINKRIMLCTLPGKAGERATEVTVKVRDSSNFQPGMALEIVHDVRGACWQFQGRLPRRKGRW